MNKRIEIDKDGFLQFFDGKVLVYEIGITPSEEQYPKLQKAWCENRLSYNQLVTKLDNICNLGEGDLQG